MNDEPITITLPNGKIASQLVDLVMRKRPIGWSKRSFATYYSNLHATWLKKSLDEMIESRQDIVFRYDTARMSANSLYLRVNQAFLFLLENMDSEGKYAKLRTEVRVRREKGVGVIFEFDEVLRNPDDVGAEKIVKEVANQPKWRDKMDDYLESPSTAGTPFFQDGLVLTLEEIQELKDELGGLKNLICDVTSRHVKIIKG